MKTELPHLSVTDSYGALDGVDALVFITTTTQEGPVVTTGVAGDLIAAYGIDVPATVTQLSITGEVGQVKTLPLPPLVGDDRWAHLPPMIVFVGLGEGANCGDRARQAGGALARALPPDSVAAVAGLDALSPASVSGLAQGILLGAYRHPFRGTTDKPHGPQEVRFVEVDEPTVKRGIRLATATTRARQWAAMPSNIKTPQWLASQAQKYGRRYGLSVRIRDEGWINAQGMGGLAAVGRGSQNPPRFVTVEYTPQGARPGRIVVVGKGITFDTGGISIKPRESMASMKTDMTGAAVALSAVITVARNQAPTSIAAVLPMAENAFSGSAYRPGDVLRMVDGTTVEIGNTDAEGRLVLADAMAWARAQYKPHLLIDVATLTGAATLGLGKIHGALYTSHSSIATTLIESGAATGEPLWHMPLVEDYRSTLDSSVADLCHITPAGVGAGSITAALFLQHFAGNTPWAHLDIAGPARAGKTGGLFTEGATGFSARALTHFLSHDPLSFQR
ncbi:MAG TPA: leucyl aminopeptidase family protein [Beutenbergiaceae bacterium]|nr:leucyl aminopeptidase family protein [Beutenbergiaceae bacterium]